LPQRLTGQAFKIIKRSCMTNGGTSISSVILKTGKWFDRVDESLLWRGRS